MRAWRFTTILPVIPRAEALETTRLPRVAGRTGARTAPVPPPFCRPARDSNAIGTGNGDTDYTIRERHHYKTIARTPLTFTSWRLWRYG
jgi:hypothetical protein